MFWFGLRALCHKHVVCNYLRYRHFYENNKYFTLLIELTLKSQFLIVELKLIKPFWLNNNYKIIRWFSNRISAYRGVLSQLFWFIFYVIRSFFLKMFWRKVRDWNFQINHVYFLSYSNIYTILLQIIKIIISHTQTYSITYDDL